MSKWCLIPEKADKFKNDIISGKINPEKLASMSSEDRRAFLTDYVGKDNAAMVNANFESKLLLKNQQEGIATWARNLAGIKPEVRRDMISKISKINDILDPKDKEMFMNDLVNQKLGIGVTQEEAQTIARLSKKVQEYDIKNSATDVESYLGSKKLSKPTDAMLKSGYAKVDLADYVNDLKLKAQKKTAKYYATHPGEALVSFGGATKSMRASIDNGAIFRQGWKTMMTHPKQWLENSVKSFSYIGGELKGKNMMREVNADIISRPTYDLAKKAGLKVGNIEEAYPSHMPTKYQSTILGKMYKASESAYTGFIQKTRMDVFDQYLIAAKKAGVDIYDEKQLKGIATLVNNLTGRADLGALEKASNVVNNLFFSPRYFVSNLNVLTAHTFDKSITPYARKQAAKNLVKIIGGTASVLAIANAVAPGSVEVDPRSANFGKIKIGDTRFDVSGGMSSILTLAARMLPSLNEGKWSQFTKSSTTGRMTDLNSSNPTDSNLSEVFQNFMESKLSPLASVGNQLLLTKQDFSGNPLTPIGIATNLFVPMTIANMGETMNNPNSANILATTIADGLGISANSYSPYGSSGGNTWSKSESQEKKAFKNSVGEAKFKEAGDKFDTTYSKWLNDTTKTQAYKKLSGTDKTRLINKEKAKLQDEIFKQYNFKYKAPKLPPVDSSLLKSLNQIGK